MVGEGNKTAPIRRGAAALSGGTRALPERTSVPLEEPTSAVDAAGLSPGLRVGNYELIRELGRGGMGVVFLARDTKLGRRVAVKFVIDSDPEFLKRFLVEARATARCQHENIVVIHEVDNYEQLPFMVLEYLEGRPLDDLIDASPMPAPRAVELTLPIARALAHAHSHGIVHRDLKLDNVFVTDSGTVKVLDFGIATALGRSERDPESRRARRPTPGLPMHITQAGVAVGTPQYMAPEQIRGDAVDRRTDIWAFGVLLHILLTGRHPLGLTIDHNALARLATTPEPLPSCAALMAGADPSLAAIVDRCLQKDPDRRFATADELAQNLDRLRHGGIVTPAGTDYCPYPGLVSFSEGDAGNFFGRDADVARMLSRLSEQPLMAVVGPSGAGKSSFVRAGVVPALRGRGNHWDVHSLRPGTQPLAALAALAARLDTQTRPIAAGTAATSQDLRAKLIEEPGTLGEILRGRASASRSQQLLFIDQFEELYTLVSDREQRDAVVRSLLAAADDAASPVRVVLSMRSDFIDRAAESSEFMTQLTRGLLFLGPMHRSSLRQALEAPAERCGYHFESPELVESMLEELSGTPSPLPLLQFGAAHLWNERDRDSQTLTEASYAHMGGIAGALASHADQIISEMTPDERQQVRAMFARLVTADHTRAVIPAKDLVALHADSSRQRDLLDRLAEARLLVIHVDTDEATVEIIHESLIESWPTLRDWLEADREDAAFLRELHAASALWNGKKRSPGLLWRGDALAEARLWRKRSPNHSLPPAEDAFLQAVFAEADRAQRTRKALWSGVFAALLLVAVGAVVALMQIRAAEKSAVTEAARAREEAARATAALEQKNRAEREATAAGVQAKRAAAAATRESEKARLASEQVAMSKEDLREANALLAEAAEKANKERDRARSAQSQAEREAERARNAEAEVRKKQVELTRVLGELRKRVKILESRASQISSDL